ncbi:ribonuclease P protein component 1 [Candidatus Micrarchaeota archaeon]|nr:ribonuclease P protein component 1 [Candidatus Micrarchaeota archaeon]
MRTKQNILYHTFIGLDAEVINSSSRELVGKKGKIIDETKNLIVIESERGKEIKIPKTSCAFCFNLEDGTNFSISGEKIAFRPEERAKKLM